MAVVTTYVYRVVSCCDTRLFAEFESTSNLVTGTYTYTGPTYTDPINGFEWVSGNCYQIVKIGTGGVPDNAQLPISTDLDKSTTDCFDPDCPCGTDERYLIFEKCCDGSLIYFKSTQDGGYLLGLKEYTGAPTYLLENICYRVDTVSVGIGPIVDNTMWNALPLAPNAPNYINAGGTNFTVDCSIPSYQAECPTCTERCFLLTNCDGDRIYTNTNLTLYLGQVITISDQDYEPIPGEWFVIQIDAPCDPESYFSSLQVTSSGLTSDCPCLCYEITGTPAEVIYFDCDQVLQESIGAGTYCSKIPPIVIGNQQGTVAQIGICVDGICQEICYKFVNCQTAEEIVVSNSLSISQYYVDNKVVTLNGYDGCWSIELSEECECPVNVTILQVFDDCPSCLPDIAYKFTNCNNQAVIKYSTDDYSAYVGKTVELDCGECWFVEQIDYIPSVTQPITILFTFDNCLACNRTYYKLTDCLDPNNTIYTYTDLSALFVLPTPQDCTDCINVTFKCNNVNYSFDLPVTGTNDGKRKFRITNISICNYANADIEILWVQDPIPHWSFAVLGTEISSISNDTECPFGSYPNSSAIEVPFTNIVVAPCSVPPVIKIKGCDTCFTVEETREPINAGIVTVTDSFIDCPECLLSFPCACNTISNTSSQVQTYCYIDCNLEIQSIELQPGETSDKLCVSKWIECPESTLSLDTAFIETFGDCNSTGNICYNYVITVPAFNEEQTVYYKNCEGVVSSEVFPLLRQPFDFTICGIDGQTSSDIYTTATELLTFEKTIICDQPIFTCPVTPLPKRKVKPGYSTPSCDIEKYEKITCKSSEFYYKQVMRLRYGISNCCPEEEEKWLIKKELIDLDALRDPDYICQPVTTCCNQPISGCGCDCNTTLKTCNS